MGCRWRQWREDPRGRVYFTRFFDVTGLSFIKIGRTVQRLPDRMRSVAADAWLYRRVLFVDWEVLGVAPGDFLAERAAQHALRKHMIWVARRGMGPGYTEFFEDIPAVRRAVEKVAEPVSIGERDPDERFRRWRDIRLAECGPRAWRFAWYDGPDAGGCIQRRLPIGIASIEVASRN